MNELAAEQRAEARRERTRGPTACRRSWNRIAEMAPEDRALAEPVHVTVTAPLPPSCHPRRGRGCPPT